MFPSRDINIALDLHRSYNAVPYNRDIDWYGSNIALVRTNFSDEEYVIYNISKD